MADVTGDDRGQLILVGGIVVAFGLVALVLLLNTALFAENIGTRGLGPGPDRASDHAAFADRAADRILRHEERVEYVKWQFARENTTSNVFRVAGVLRARQFQQHGSFTIIEPIRLRQGAVLVQTDRTRNFTAGGLNVSEDDWQLATTTGIRNFSMTVDAANTLNKTSPGNFTVKITGNAGTGRTWSAEVYSQGGVVEVHTGDTTCTSATQVATINWTSGSLGGCEFPFAVDAAGDELVSPYSIQFVNGSSASGSYHLVVSREVLADIVRVDSFGDPNTAENPRLYHGVYSVRLQVRYEESTIDYETHVRSAPNEPEQTSPAT